MLRQSALRRRPTSVSSSETRYGRGCTGEGAAGNSREDIAAFYFGAGTDAPAEGAESQSEGAVVAEPATVECAAPQIRRLTLPQDVEPRATGLAHAITVGFHAAQALDGPI